MQVNMTKAIQNIAKYLMERESLESGTQKKLQKATKIADL
jgi:hypothetical protein